MRDSLAARAGERDALFGRELYAARGDSGADHGEGS